jgi:hypothetical protein
MNQNAEMWIILALKQSLLNLWWGHSSKTANIFREFKLKKIKDFIDQFYTRWMYRRMDLDFRSKVFLSGRQLDRLKCSSI